MIMESSFPSYDDELSGADLSRAHCLELAYLESVRVSDFIIQDEAVRRLRLQILLLEDENDELHGQLVVDDSRIDQLEQDCVELQRRVNQAEATSTRCETDLRMKIRELSSIKAELTSMNGLSTDSTRLLTEKLSLTRELTIIKTELDHLRSQANYQQTVLAEKLALQRQVNTLEVELETVKRASKRTGYKAVNSNENDTQKEVDELRKELSRERREKEKAEKAVQKSSGEWESRKTMLESKVEQLRIKLRESKAQVKELQSELSEALASITMVSATVTSGVDLLKQGRKRTANQMSADSVIGTPDGVAVRGKRLAVKGGKQDQVLLGEKSMFSITPYLNRTLSIAPETPKTETEVDVVDKREVNSTGHDPIPGLASLVLHHEASEEGNDDTPGLDTLQLQQKTKTKEKAVLTDANNKMINAKALQKKRRTIGILEKVAEEEDENEERLPSTGALPVTKSTMQTQGTAVGKIEPKKKKRKLLRAAKTIFDEDDGEATKRPPKVNLRPAKALGKDNSTASELGLQNGLNGNGRRFGAFSPLKKDRRAAQVSFVA